MSMFENAKDVAQAVARGWLTPDGETLTAAGKAHNDNDGKFHDANDKYQPKLHQTRPTDSGRWFG